MANILIKTEAGQRELGARAVDLPRSARTLLVLVDGARSSDELLTMVRGSSSKDIDALLQAGLIVLGGQAAGAQASTDNSTNSAAPVEAAPVAVKLEFKELYACLTEMIRQQVGVMKAFKYTLEVEKAGTIDDLMGIAKRFVDDVQKQKGDSAANMVRRALGITH